MGGEDGNNAGASYVAESPRLWLEPLSVERHLDDFYELWVTEEAVRYTTRTPQTSIEESKTFLTSILTTAENPDVDKFAVLLRPVPENAPPNRNPPSAAGAGAIDGGEERDWEIVNKYGRPKCIGIVGTNRRSDQGMETGYCMNSRYWGKGYATEAFSLFLKIYWDIEKRREITSIVAKVHPGNAQSFKVVRKCGGLEGEVIHVEMRYWKEGVDLHCFYYYRPGFEEEGEEKRKERLEKKEREKAEEEEKKKKSEEDGKISGEGNVGNEQQ